MKKDYSITKYFGYNLAELLSDKILPVYSTFNKKGYVESIKEKCDSKAYTERIEMHAVELYQFLPHEYKKALPILEQIFGEENEMETGMFTNFYWLLPIGKYIELYGLHDFDISIKAISEITKRNTGEYTIRPFIRKYPQRSLEVMKEWALSDNFHLRRLASEGLRPKLPWSKKLDTFIEEPSEVFEILELLKEDPIKYVQKSVANHLTDYIKVNQEPTVKLLKMWNKSENKYTKWIVKHAIRKYDIILS